MKKLAFVLLVMATLAGCSKHGNPAPAALAPGVVQLVAPAANEVCVIGTALSPVSSTVQFSWSAATNAGSYELVVKDLLTADSISQTSYYNQAGLNLSRNTPYSWYVIARSGKTSQTSRSAIWKFYNSGPGVISYAPFPAEIVSPPFWANGRRILRDCYSYLERKRCERGYDPKL